MKHTIVFNYKSLADYGVYISGKGVFNAPERDTESVQIPGRNGELTIDNGRYKNLALTYPAFIIRDFKENVQGLRNYLLSQKGYVRLEDDYYPEEFRLAKWTGAFETDPIEELYAANFNLTFSCYPQRFLKSGEQPIEITAASATINNGNLTTALPLIRAYGTGSFSIGGIAVQITSASGYTDIDCDLQEAYKDTLATNCNGNIVLTNGKFPELVPGENTITLSGITKLEIVPRWWQL